MLHGNSLLTEGMVKHATVSCSVIVLIYLCLAVPHCWHRVYCQVLLERGVKHSVLMGCNNHIVIRLTINRKLCW